jgi:quercetin dioxygenase-like cupin family protein
MRAFVLAAADGRAFDFLGTRMIRKAGAAETGGALGLIEQRLPPGFEAPPHTHQREDEAFYILEGAFTFRSGQHTFDAQPGAFVFLPRGAQHSFTVSAAGPGRLLQLNTPAGLAQFFEDVAGPPDLSRVLQVAESYGIDIS